MVDAPKVINVVVKGIHSGKSHICCSLITPNMCNNAKPTAIGTPTNVNILAIILLYTTCGTSSSSSLLVLLDFSVRVAVSFRGVGGLPVKPLAALARGLSVLLMGCFRFSRVVGWRNGLLGFHGGGLERWRGVWDEQMRPVSMASNAMSTVLTDGYGCFMFECSRC